MVRHVPCGIAVKRVFRVRIGSRDGRHVLVGGTL